MVTIKTVSNSSQRTKSLKVTKLGENTTCNNLNTLIIRIKNIHVIHEIYYLSHPTFTRKGKQLLFFRSQIWFKGFIIHNDLNYL